MLGNLSSYHVRMSRRKKRVTVLTGCFKTLHKAKISLVKERSVLRQKEPKKLLRVTNAYSVLSQEANVFKFRVRGKALIIAMCNHACALLSPWLHHGCTTLPKDESLFPKPQALRHTPKLSLITPIIPLSSLPAQWGLPTAPKSGLHYICSTLDVIAIAPSPQNSKTFERKDNLILD